MTSMIDPDPTQPNLESLDKLKAAPPPCAWFLVMAHRWGAVNNDWYFVYGGEDFGKAYAMAKAEVEFRGGKYAAAVYGFHEKGETNVILAYFPSTMEEDTAEEPHHNHRRDFFERLGIFLNDAATGEALLPDPADAQRLTYQAVECPEFMKVEVARQKETYQALTVAEESLEERRRTRRPQ